MNTLLRSFLGLCKGACKWGHWSFNSFSFMINFLLYAHNLQVPFLPRRCCGRCRVDPLCRHVPLPFLPGCCCEAMVERGSSPWDCWLPKPLRGVPLPKPLGLAQRGEACDRNPPTSKLFLSLLPSPCCSTPICFWVRKLLSPHQAFSSPF